MENFGLCLLVILSVIHSVRGDSVHLTMVTPTPYGAGSSANISCFRSSPDAGVALSFGRPFQIGLPGSTVQTSTTLPDGSTQTMNGQAVTQYLTSSNDATGLFYCEGSNRSLTTRVYSIIHSIHRRFEPTDGQVTRTVNKGEDVTLSVTQVKPGYPPIWRRTRNGTMNENLANRNQLGFVVSSADAVHGDLYTVIGNGVTLTDNHFSMIRLIVRGCVAGKWGPPGCDGVCDMCYNGGVCDDKTGNCICPPGFSGPNCLTACGMHKFGWDCEFDCASSPYSCNSQFGLPDPYGNSCISGYMGTYCNESCPSGTFGAGCNQTCRCQAGDAACNRFTGECTPSLCQDSWSGTTCQIPGTCPTGKYGLDCLGDCHCANNTACVRDSGYCSGSNGACADGFKSDVNANNCQTESSTAVPTPSMNTVAGPTMAEVTITPGGSEDSTTVSTATNPTPMSLVGVVVPVVIVLVLLLILVILLIVLVKCIRDKKHAEVDGGSSMQGKFESSNDLSSLQTIDNPISIPMEDINSNPNGDVVPETTPAIRPESSVSQISTLDSSSPFAGLPLYPTKERELKKDPIPLKDFVAYVRQAVRGHELRDEWTSFPGIEAICSCDVSQLPDNKMKNRYRNIPAYDHCRVILEHDKDDPNLGYINACYIKGYKKDKAYIATQGPNQATLHDFWKMVWQENVHIIVNGTNLVEDGKNKCAKYWPDMEKLETFGGISISLVKEETRGEYEVRTMIMSKIDDNKSASRKIRQYHYTTWPDKDVPKDVTPVFRLIKEFSDATPEGAGPYLIHCSAGVGRTGAIIAIHALLQQAHAEKTLDIYNFVADMRDHRVSIVQTPVQYTFIHLALLEALFSGDTCVPSSSLKKRVAELKKKKKMAEEFEQLNMISPVPIAERCRSSMMESNHNKNRLPSTLVPESCRPFLMTPREDGMEYNYINAAFVNGYKQKDVAVVTQAPLPNTVLDLWRLVYDYQMTSIVMLNAMDLSDSSCPQYWPDEGSQDHGLFTVTVANVVKFDGYNVKLMKLEHRRQKRSQYLKHYQVTDWPVNQEMPKSPSTLLRLILTVEKEKKEKHSPILVHCIDGLNRSGVFCILKNSLDRLRQDDMVDIMQTTKVLRLNRPNMLNSLNLYRFCYDAMLAYVSNPDEFKADRLPEPVYENMPTKQKEEKAKPPENIYQNVAKSPESSEA